MATERAEVVVVQDSETIVARGYRKVVWFVLDDAGWCAATRCPEAEVEDEDPGPGTVWARRVTLRLQRQRALMRVESVPRAEASRDVLDYLRHETRLAERHTRRDYFRVGRGGELERVTVGELGTAAAPRRDRS